MSLSLFIGLLAVLCLAFVIMGKMTAGTHHSKEEFFLGKRDVGFFPLTMTFFAAQIGGGALLGSAEEAFNHGWVALAYPAGLVIGMLAIAAGFGARLRTLHLVTVSELFTKVYDSRHMRMVASLLFTTSLFLILVAQATAARKFFNALGLSSPVLFLGCWGVMIFYTALGGLKAVIATDILQGFVKVASLVLLWWTASATKLEFPCLADASDLIATPWVDWLVMPVLFMLIAQDMGQRCFAAKSPQTVTRAAITSALVFAVVSIVPIYFGVRARVEGLSVPEGTAVFLAAAQAFTNPYTSAICAVGVLMALISIANSLLCSISSQVSCDLPLMQRSAFGRSVRSAQWVTVVLGLAAALCSYAFTSVIPLLVLSYEVSVSVLFFPIFAVVIGRPLSKNAAWCSMAIGALSYATASALALPLAKALLALFFSALPMLWMLCRGRAKIMTCVS